MSRLRNRIISILIANISATTLCGCFGSEQKLGTAVEKQEASTTQSNTKLSSDRFFHSEKIGENITRIHGVTGELMYLVEGTEKAALIDTGTGVGDLRKYVEKLTKKPIIVLLTHGHVDHAMGAPDFDEVYMNPADKDVYTENSYLSVRKSYISLNNKELVEKLNDEEYVKVKPVDYIKSMVPGDVFNLGGTNLEICQGAGHTPGQITILFREQRILLLGDAANNLTFLFDGRASGVNSYEKSMKELQAKTEGRYDKVYMSHGSGELPKEILSGIIQVCEDIKAGNVDDVPFSFLGQQAYIAKALTPNGERVDNGIGNIVYSKEKVMQ